MIIQRRIDQQYHSTSHAVRVSATEGGGCKCGTNGNGGGNTKNKNIAKVKSTSQSSYYKGLASSTAVDGNMDSVTHTNKDSKAWWEVNLGGKYLIDFIKVYNRKDCCTDRLSNFDLTITNDGKEVWKYQQTGKAPEVTDIDVPANISGNKVKLQLRGVNYLSLAEFEVFGLENIAIGKRTS